MSYINNVYVTGRNLGKTAQVSPLRTLAVHDNIRLVGTPFYGISKDTNFWTETTSSTAVSASIGGGQLTLSTCATANGTTTVQSVRVARYISGVANKFRGVVRFPDTNTNHNIRRFGPFDSSDGYFFELSGSSLYVGSRKSAVDTKVSQSAWTGQAFNFDTNVHTWEVQYTNSSAWYFVDENLIHTISAPTTPSTSTQHLPITLYNSNINSSTSTALLEVRVASILRMGQDQTTPQFKNLTTNTTSILKYGPGTLHTININTKGATNNVLTVYDGTGSLAGYEIGLIDTTAVQGSLTYNCPFFRGLTVVSATGTAANITVIYE